jgi:hypothetical protein
MRCASLPETVKKKVTKLAQLCVNIVISLANSPVE